MPKRVAKGGGLQLMGDEWGPVEGGNSQGENEWERRVGHKIYKGSCYLFFQVKETINTKKKAGTNLDYL